MLRKVSRNEPFLHTRTLKNTLVFPYTYPVRQSKESNISRQTTPDNRLHPSWDYCKTVDRGMAIIVRDSHPRYMLYSTFNTLWKTETSLCSPTINLSTSLLTRLQTNSPLESLDNQITFHSLPLIYNTYEAKNVATEALPHITSSNNFQGFNLLRLTQIQREDTDLRHELFWTTMKPRIKQMVTRK